MFYAYKQLTTPIKIIATSNQDRTKHTTSTSNTTNKNVIHKQKNKDKSDQSDKTRIMLETNKAKKIPYLKRIKVL